MTEPGAEANAAADAPMPQGSDAGRADPGTRLRAFAALAAAFSRALTPEDVLDALATTVMTAVGASGAGVALLAADGATCEIVRGSGYPPEVDDAYRRFPLDASLPLAEAIRTGQSVWLETQAAWAERYPNVAAENARIGHVAAASVPLVVDQRTLGGLGISFAGEHAFSEDDRVLLRGVADACAQALDRAQLHEAERRARAAAEEALRAREELLSAAAHEFRTPITAIKGYAELLDRWRRSGELTTERLAHAIAQIGQRADRLTRLVHDHVAFTRAEAATGQRRPVDLCAAVREAVTRAQHAAPPSYRIDCDAPDDALVVTADADQIAEMLDHLLDNAVKYSHAGGEIRVTVERRDGGVELCVADQGIGIPAEFLTGVFEPFARARNAQDRAITGIGLGLAFCKLVAEQHGGRIWAASDGDGRGTDVRVFLPFG